jgi:hypothetical protein
MGVVINNFHHLLVAAEMSWRAKHQAVNELQETAVFLLDIVGVFKPVSCTVFVKLVLLNTCM